MPLHPALGAPELLCHTVQGRRAAAPPLSIRRFVDERFQFIHAAIEISAAEEGREDSRMSSSALLVVLWQIFGRTGRAAPCREGHTGSSPLNVSALLWERMLQHNALKSVAQAKLAALTSSLETRRA